jgi:hypothetical protein
MPSASIPYSRRADFFTNSGFEHQWLFFLQSSLHSTYHPPLRFLCEALRFLCGYVFPEIREKYGSAPVATYLLLHRYTQLSLIETIIIFNL